MLHGGAAEDKDFTVCPGGKGLHLSRDTVYIRRRPIQIKNLPEPKFRETERTHRSKSGQGNQLTKLNVRICDFTYVAESKRARTSQGVEHKPYVQFAVRYQKRIAKCTQMLKKET